ncbi:hypothetical protein TIFTF001_030199 [Ficus carica]|uniref:Uncharacterized protein n=1 Tax=Ficus carica TaxID=3494 RepID=A0AA88DSS6_FICCA|nr:hypothetical protein TIFTF001_030199 [Ficus carica]
MASKLPVLYRPALGRVGLWFELEMVWPPQPLHSRAPGKQPSAMVDTRWKGMAGQTVKCGKSSCYAFCSFMNLSYGGSLQLLPPISSSKAILRRLPRYSAARTHAHGIR